MSQRSNSAVTRSGCSIVSMWAAPSTISSCAWLISAAIRLDNFPQLKPPAWQQPGAAELTPAPGSRGTRQFSHTTIFTDLRVHEMGGAR